MNDISGTGRSENRIITKFISPEPEDIYEQLIALFQKKYKRLNFKEDKFILINGKRIRIVLPDASLVPFFFRPFAHLEAKNKGEVSLEIICFRTGKDFSDIARNVFPGFSNMNGRDVPFHIKRGIIMSTGRESDTFSFLNTERKRALFLFDEIGNLPYFEAGSPLKKILQWWFDSSDTTMLHSASVCRNGKAILIAGRGGKGKTSTALACMTNGMDYLGDDYIVVEGNNEFSVSSVYNSAKLTSESYKRFPELREVTYNPDFKRGEKGIVFLRSFSVSTAALMGIVLPEISTDEGSSFIRVSSAEGFRALAPSTIFQHIGRRRNISEFTARLTKNLPCYKLKAGRDPELISNTVKNILKEL